MPNVIEYTHPATGLRHKFTLPNPVIDLAIEGQTNNFRQLQEAVLSMSATVPASGSGTSAVASRGVEARLNLFGAYHDALYGGPGIPPGVLQDQMATITADVSAGAESLTVDRYATTWSGVSTNFIVASTKMLLMNRLPLPGENIWTTGVTNCAAEIVDIASGYTGSTTVALDATLSQPITARKAGAVLIPISAPAVSYFPQNGFDKGIIYELERPQPPTTITGVDGTSQTINATFIRSIHERDTAGTFESRTGYGVVSHYAFFVLKKGNDYSVYAPEYLPDRAMPSQYADGGQQNAVLAITAAKLVDGTTTTACAGLNRYWNPVDNALTAIVAGTYFVGVTARNQANRDINCRESKIAWSAAVVVA